jgi:ABC-type dipeptide/oligopeptide/nickel transport system permease subunit
MRKLARGLLIALLACAAFVLLRPGPSYSAQDREAIMEGSSARHTTGTDQLGRDRTVRTAAALLLGIAGAASASALTTVIAAAVGTFAAFSRPVVASGTMLLVDLFLALPWIFLLMMVRSGLPLNTSPLHSAAITFVLLAALGWPACARAVYGGACRLRGSEGMIQGRASGLRSRQLIRLHLLPHLRSLLLPQFLICIPAFIVAEANLGTLGLGIAEPLPSWGSMLQELDASVLLASTHWIYLPLTLLVLVLLLLESLVVEV